MTRSITRRVSELEQRPESKARTADADQRDLAELLAKHGTTAEDAIATYGSVVAWCWHLMNDFGKEQQPSSERVTMDDYLQMCRTP